MATTAFQDLESQVELANVIPQGEIPGRLRCASCNKLAVFAWKPICCDQTLCEPCKNDLGTKCPVCEHSPLDPADCKELNALRQTVRLFLKKYVMKRDKGAGTVEGDVAAPVAPSPAVDDSSAPAIVADEGREAEGALATNMQDSEQAVVEPAATTIEGDIETSHTSHNASRPPPSEAQAADDEVQSDAESDSSIEINIGDDSSPDKPRRPSTAIQQAAAESQMPPHANARQSNNWNTQNRMQNGVQNGMPGGTQNTNVSGFNNMNFDPTMLQQMMSQGGMGANWSDMSTMMGMNPMAMQQGMFGNGYAGFGMNGMNNMNAMDMMNGMNNMTGMNMMNGMNGMNMGMNYGNMGFGGGWGGQQMGSGYDGNAGFYPNVGFNQQQMQYQQYPNHSQNGFQGRGTFNNRGFGRGRNRANQFGQPNWQAGGAGFDPSAQGQFPSTSRPQTAVSSHSRDQDNRATPSGIAEQSENQPSRSTEGDQQAGAHESTRDEALPAEKQQVEATDRVAADKPDSVQTVEDTKPIQAFQGGFADRTSETFQENNDFPVGGLQHHGSAQDNYNALRGGHFQRGFGRGAWRGRGAPGGYGHAQYAQGGPPVISAAPPQGAPTGPRSMRQPQAGFARGRGGFQLGGPPARDSPSYGSQSPAQQLDKLPDRTVDESRPGSRSRADVDTSSARRQRSRSYSVLSQPEDRNTSRGEPAANEDEVDYGDVDSDSGYARAPSPAASRQQSSRQDPDEQRSSRSHRDRSKEDRRERRRTRSPEDSRRRDRKRAGDADTADQTDSEGTRRVSRSERHHDRDRERNDARRREKESRRDRERSSERKRKRSKRDRSRSNDREYRSDNDQKEDGRDKHSSSRRDRGEKRPRHREREDDYEGDRGRYDKDDGDHRAYGDREDRRRSDRDRKSHDENASSSKRRHSRRESHRDERDSTSTQEVEFQIVGRSNALQTAPPTGPRAHGKPSAPTAQAARSSRHEEPLTASQTPAADPHQEEREKRNRERMLREQQRRQTNQSSAAPSGPRRFR